MESTIFACCAKSMLALSPAYIVISIAHCITDVNFHAKSRDKRHKNRYNGLDSLRKYAFPNAMNSSSESVSPRRFASIPHSSSMSGMHSMKALPAFPLLAKYVLNELEMVLRRLAKAASAIAHVALRSASSSGSPSASNTGLRSRRKTDESTCGGGKKLL